MKFGMEVHGIGFDSDIGFLEETLEYRDEGLPDGHVVVENCDEWHYCIDCATGEIVSWRPDGEAMVEFPCFDDCLLGRLNDSVENM